MSDAANESFAFGSELMGRGYATHLDYVVGGITLAASIVAVLLGFYNLYLVKTITIFHNAFGAFWASRTVGEIGSNAVYVLYSGPMTLLQPKWVHPYAGILIFTIGYFFACHACVMHQVVSANRMIAVCLPLKYRLIFSKRVCQILIAMCWIEVAFVVLLYLVVPCQMVGPITARFSTTGMERDFSYVGTVVNRFCFCVCFATVITDLITLVKIVQIKKSGKQTSTFRRDVRFFFQTSVQNITMMMALTMIVVANNSQSPDSMITQILGFDTLIITHINNALALIIFNPEVRARIAGKSTNSIGADSGPRQVPPRSTDHSSHEI
ncbi:hypothetical protein QR680_016192 [Steinernema hermaphroditum]|uniref:7TM GPCR serpentine receptor class x (Srx) domain-containing protein n=1 Tax=Steinernema hermaphroditum TaxID=289476 RepID=A0AA39HCJ4_9BILA|nr:hypothetical protein QR680_016192 [Steinernema hermaphroditum]